MQSKYFLGIGINYIGTTSELHGCINDVIATENFFKNKFPDLQSNFLTDFTVKKPTKEVILTELQTLLLQSKPFDTIILHYSGHGMSIVDNDNDEIDKKDECIVPVDMSIITDDELNKLLFTYLKPGVFLFCLFDSCFSGTVLDLKYTYISSSSPIQKNNEKPQPKGKIIMISGCRDDQTSADAFINKIYSGALTAAFLDTYSASSSWTNLIENIRVLLKTNYTQIPLLSFNNGNINDRLL
jgi:metacaspase-1